MWVRNWKSVWWVLGFSLALSGCLKVEATTTVLEDGRIIDHVVMQPKNSLLTLLALSEQGPNMAGHGSDMLRTFSDVCKLADEIYSEVYKALARQKIPYSAVPVPTDFEFSGIAGNGCSIQIGPYDPRILPTDFAQEMLGIRIERATGLHDPYRMFFVGADEALDGIPSSASMEAEELRAGCSGELEPAPCEQELRLLSGLIGSWTMEGENSGEFSDVLSAPGMLGGAAEMLRMVLKGVPVMLRIPADTAVSMVHGNWAFEYGQGWIWRGSAMEWMAASEDPGLSLQIRPTRDPTPSTR